MKTKLFLALAILFSVAIPASAQVQLLFMDMGRNVIDRNKKLYWMDGDDDPCYDILNYKKAGTKETFKLKSKEDPSDTYSVAITLSASGEPQSITITDKSGNKTTSKVSTTCGKAERDAELTRYFRGLAGYPPEPSVTSATSASSVAKNPAEIKSSSSPKDATDKVKDATKDAVGKVKGLFKKKKK